MSMMHAHFLRASSTQVIGAKPVLLPVASVLDVVFQGHPVLLLYFVMIMCPLVMNIIQVCPSCKILLPSQCTVMCCMLHLFHFLGNQSIIGCQNMSVLAVAGFGAGCCIEIKHGAEWEAECRPRKVSRGWCSAKA